MGQDLIPSDADLRLTTLPISGVQSRAYLFNGTTDDINLAGLLTIPSGDYTISFWINFQDVSIAVQVLLGTGGVADTIRFEFFAGDVHSLLWKEDNVQIAIPGISTPLIGPNIWRHVILERSGGNITYFIGQLNTPPTSVGTAVKANAEFDTDRIGVRGASTENLNAKLFDLRIYDAALSTANKAVVNDFRTPPGTTLLAYYRMQDTNATTAEDLAASNDGTKSITDPPFHYLGTDVPHSYVLAEDTEISDKAVQGLDILEPGTLIVVDIEGNQKSYVFTGYVEDAAGESARFPYRLMGRFRTIKAGSTITPSNMIAIH